MTLGHGILNATDMEHIADLLMGAAFADGELDGSESTTVREILAGLLDGELPSWLTERVDNFDPASFDLEATCKRADLPQPKDKRALLALLVKVIEADEIEDLDEGAYVQKVAKLMGLSAAEMKGLAVEVVSVNSLSAPPPVPNDPASKFDRSEG